MSIYDPKMIFIEPLMGFRHIGHLFSASANCAHTLNDNANNAIKTHDFIINGYQQLYQNRDVYIHIKYSTFMRGSREGWGGILALETFLLPTFVFKSHKWIFYNWINVSCLYVSETTNIYCVPIEISPP